MQSLAASDPPCLSLPHCLMHVMREESARRVIQRGYVKEKKSAINLSDLGNFAKFAPGLSAGFAVLSAGFGDLSAGFAAKTKMKRNKERRSEFLGKAPRALP